MDKMILPYRGKAPVIDPTYSLLRWLRSSGT